MVDELEAMRRKKVEREAAPDRYKDCCCTVCVEPIDNESQAIRHVIMTGHQKFMPRFLRNFEKGIADLFTEDE